MTLFAKMCTFFSLICRSRTMKTCLVCFETKVVERATSRCQHARNVCEECISSYITTKIIDGETIITCPSCKVTMEPAEVRAFVQDSELYSHFTTQLTKTELSKVEGFMWCLNSRCESGEIYDLDSTRIRCSVCRFKMCYKCQCLWHHGLTCDEYQSRHETAEERGNRKYFSRHTKQCPRCSKRIEKNGGCFMMTCKRPGGCGALFCWECLGVYANGHIDHSDTCRVRDQ
jgi:hypothetical protein